MLADAIDHVKSRQDRVFQEFHAARLVSMATDTILSYLLCRDAGFADRKQKVARVFFVEARQRLATNRAYILSDEDAVLAHHSAIIDPMSVDK